MLQSLRLTIVFFGFLCACHTLTLDRTSTNPGDSTTRSETQYETQSYSHASVVAGYFEPGAAPIAECDRPVSQVRIQRDVGDSILHLLIGGIYTTRSIFVECPALASDVEPKPGPDTRRPRPVAPRETGEKFDRLHLRTGGILRGRIVGQTRATVTIRVNGRRQTISKKDIRRIEYPK